MNITLKFHISGVYLPKLNKDIDIEIPNAPYVPNGGPALWIKWEEHFDEDTALIIYNAFSEHYLAAKKTLEEWSKDGITVMYDFMPFECKCGECHDKLKQDRKYKNK